MKKRDRQYQIFATSIILYFVSIIAYFISVHNIDVAYNLNSFNYILKDCGINAIDCNMIKCSDANRIHSLGLVMNIASFSILLSFGFYFIIGKSKK